MQTGLLPLCNAEYAGRFSYIGDAVDIGDKIKSEAVYIGSGYFCAHPV